MSVSNNRIRLLFASVFLSGASGLIYEVVWHRYLAILLGAQARATAITLAIFLGGISVGYIYFGWRSKGRGKDLLRTYVLVELGLALWGLSFPFLFRAAQPAASLLYRLLGVTNFGIDILLAVLLIGVPTFLMGGTLPLLTQALAKGLENASKVHARIYGINTLGACLGSLVAGYLLIPWVGLSFAVSLAAAGNLIAATVVYLSFTKDIKAELEPRPVTSLEKFRFVIRQKDMPILMVGLLSGFYLITLQTVLVRLIGLTTGSSNYNFCLVVTIFIFALGVGSLVAKRIDEYTAKRLVWNQLILSVLLYAVFISANYWAYWAHVLRALFRDIPQGFYVYQGLLGLGLAGLLVIPLGFAGLTLPLCFHFLKDRSDNLGNRVGELYGLNTVGCVFGALVGGYLLLNFYDLDQLFKFCIFLTAVTVVFGAVPYLKTEKSFLPVTIIASLTISVFLGSLFAPRWSKGSFIQPFRHPEVIPNVTFYGRKAFDRYLSSSSQLVFYKDGPNTSVGVTKADYKDKELSRSIIINGKSDGNTRGDFFTTVMLAHIPALLSEDPKKACVIGFGTGTTIGTLALYPEIEKIDVAEISNTLIDNRSLFDAYNNGVSTNPKVNIHEMDAFRFLEGSREKFNIIVSEPSNPWVTGIENLYSQEFYTLAHNKLSSKGVFIQWIHTYSFNNDLMRMVINTMGNVFPYVSVFQLKGGDLAVVATMNPVDRTDLKRAAKRFGETPELSNAMASAGVERFESILALELVPFSLSKVIATGASEQRLETPKLSNEAAIAFFASSRADVNDLRRQYREYYPAVMDSLLADYLGGQFAGQDLLTSFRKTFCENAISKTGFLCEQTAAALKVRNPLYRPELTLEYSPNMRDLASLENYSGFPKGEFTSKQLDEAVALYEVYKRYYSPLAMLPAEAFLGRVDYCLKVVPDKDTLHGQCLLQKVLMIETVRMRGAEFKESVANYMQWFDKLPANAPSYAKLKEARDLLVKLVEAEKL